jgi:lipopolysaccharide assembly outer membrane protein LptD (OstA)
MLKRIITIAIFLLPLSGFAQEYAHILKKAIKDKPFSIIHTDHSSVDKRHKTITLTGNVTLQYFDTKVNCDTAVIHYKKLKVDLFGKVESPTLLSSPHTYVPLGPCIGIDLKTNILFFEVGR